jgi:hypothetical protein
MLAVLRTVNHFAFLATNTNTVVCVVTIIAVYNFAVHLCTAIRAVVIVVNTWAIMLKFADRAFVAVDSSVAFEIGANFPLAMYNLYSINNRGFF